MKPTTTTDIGRGQRIERTRADDTKSVIVWFSFCCCYVYVLHAVAGFISRDDDDVTGDSNFSVEKRYRDNVVATNSGRRQGENVWKPLPERYHRATAIRHTNRVDDKRGANTKRDNKIQGDLDAITLSLTRATASAAEEPAATGIETRSGPAGRRWSPKTET